MFTSVISHRTRARPMPIGAPVLASTTWSLSIFIPKVDPLVPQKYTQ